MIRNRYAVVLAAFCAFGLLGLLFPAVGASLPAIGGAFGPGPARTGLILTAFQLGYTLFCLLGGVLADLAGRRLVLVCGTLLYAAGGLLLGVPPSFEGNLALFVCLGMGSGLIYGSSNTLVIELFPERRGSVLSVHHLFYAAGTLVAPVLVNASLQAGRPWSAVYARLGLGAAALAAFFLLARPGHAGTVVTADGQGDSPPLRAGFRDHARLLGNRLFLLLLGVGALAIGVQFGVTYLLVSLLVQGRGVPLPRAALVLSLYFLTVAVGRLACGWLVARFSNTRVIVGSLLLLAFTLLAGWLGRGGLSLAFFVASGLAFSGLMPGLLALASAVLPREVRGTALGLVATAAGLGGVFIPSLTSWLAGYGGLDRAFLLVVVVSFAVAAGFFLLHGRFLAAERGVTERGAQDGA